MMQQQQQPMQGGGGANPMSPQAQWELAKLMSVKDLTAVMQGQSNRVSQSIAMSALPLAMEKATADKGLMASQQLAQNPGSVNSRMLQSQQSQLPENQGIGTLPSPNMGQVAAMAQGGVVGFAGPMGSSVPFMELAPEEFAKLSDNEKIRYNYDKNIEARNIRASAAPAGGAASVNPKAPMGLGSLANAAGAAATIGSLRRGALNAAGMPSSEDAYAYGESKKAGVRQSITDFLASQNRDVRLREAGIDPYPQETEDRNQRNPAYQVTGPTTYPQAPTAAPTAAPVSTGRPRGEGAPVSDGGIGGVPGAPARTLDEIKQSNSLAGIEALTGAAQPAAAQPTAPAGGIKALGLASDMEAAQKLTNASTQPYMDKMSELVKGLNLSAGEKENQKYTRLGNTFLSAAQELLTSGRPGASSIGAAFGKVGTLAQDYAKEDKAERKAAIGAEISMLGAHAQMAQGNTKTAIDMYQHAQKLAFEGIKLDTDTFLKQEELRLTKLGLNEKTAHNQATEASKRYQIDTEAKWRMAHIGVLGTAQKGVEQRATAATQRAEGVATTQYINSLNAIIKSKPFSPEGREAARILADPKLVRQGAQELLGRYELGLGATTPKTSIQKYTIDPADVLKVD